MLTRGCHQLALAREAVVTVEQTVTKWHSPTRALEAKSKTSGSLSLFARLAHARATDTW